MTSEALLNKELVQLSEEETKRAEQFHLKRYAFAWIKGKLTFHTKQDERDHQHWLMEDYHISLEEFEETNRGYMIDGKIQLFIGSDFKPVDPSTVYMSDIKKLINEYSIRYKDETVSICNGVKIGKVGEIWEPIEKWFTVKLKDTKQ